MQSDVPAAGAAGLLGGSDYGVGDRITDPTRRRNCGWTAGGSRIGRRTALGHPDDIAHAAVFLGSDESLHVSGQNLMVDAGTTVTRGAFEQLREMKADRERAIADA